MGKLVRWDTSINIQKYIQKEQNIQRYIIKVISVPLVSQNRSAKIQKLKTICVTANESLSENCLSDLMRYCWHNFFPFFFFNWLLAWCKRTHTRTYTASSESVHFTVQLLRSSGENTDLII